MLNILFIETNAESIRFRIGNSPQGYFTSHGILKYGILDPLRLDDPFRTSSVVLGRIRIWFS